MPYLDTKSKAQMDAGIPPRSAGELTYCLTKQIQKYLASTSIRYGECAIVLGALEGCKADFIERVLKPYEANKREQNGDVW